MQFWEKFYKSLIINRQSYHDNDDYDVAEFDKEF